MVRECRPLERELSSLKLGRRSTMRTSVPANVSSAASIIPVGPPPAITTTRSDIHHSSCGGAVSAEGRLAPRPRAYGEEPCSLQGVPGQASRDPRVRHAKELSNPRVDDFEEHREILVIADQSCESYLWTPSGLRLDADHRAGPVSRSHRPPHRARFAASGRLSGITEVSGWRRSGRCG